MKKILLIIIVLTYTYKVSSQDSIVNYLDRNGKVIDKERAVEIETIVKKDTLWRVTNYYRNGKIKKHGHFRTKEKKIPVGEFVKFSRTGKASQILFYNLIGEKNGRYRSWFDNGNISSIGMYLNSKKESIWKYYHYNGVEACRQFFKNDSIIKTVIHDEKGNLVIDKLVENKKAEFKGGQDKFTRKVKRLTDNIDYQIKGRIYVHFVINVYGKIQDVTIDEDLPDRLNKQIVSFFENIEGWEPAIHMNRKISTTFNIPLNFNML